MKRTFANLKEIVKTLSDTPHPRQRRVVMLANCNCVAYFVIDQLMFGQIEQVLYHKRPVVMVHPVRGLDAGYILLNGMDDVTNLTPSSPASKPGEGNLVSLSYSAVYNFAPSILAPLRSASGKSIPTSHLWPCSSGDLICQLPGAIHHEWANGTGYC